MSLPRSSANKNPISGALPETGEDGLKPTFIRQRVREGTIGQDKF